MEQNTPKTLSYLRVSTDRQDVEKDKIEILDLVKQKGFGEVEFVEEIITGKAPWKTRKIKSVIDRLERLDRLVVPELSRLGRSMLEVMEILSVCTEKGVEVYSVRDRWELNSSLQSKVIATVFAMAAEIERDLLSARVKEALRARREKGLPHPGRPKGTIVGSRLDKYKIEIWALRRAGSTKRFIGDRYGVTEATVYGWMKSRKVEKEEEELVRQKTAEYMAAFAQGRGVPPWEALSPEDESITRLPDGCMDRMRDAAVNCRLDILLEIAGEAETYDKRFANKLRKYIRKYDYDAIFKVLGIHPRFTS